MKRSLALVIIIVGLFIYLPSNANASNISDSVILAWDDANSNDNSGPGYGFKVFQRKQGDQYDFKNPIATVMYVNGKTEYSATTQISVIGDPGSTVTLYWVARAFNNSGESGNSNQVSKEFTFPYDELAAPPNLRIVSSGPDTQPNPDPQPNPGPNPDPQPEPEPIPIIEKHELEAEDGILDPNMDRISDNTASGGVYIAIPKSASSSSGRADYDFIITEAGNYIVIGLVNCSTAGNNSFTIQVNGLDEGIWHTAVTGGTWMWDVFGDRTATDSTATWPIPTSIYLDSGENTISLFGREKDTKIDKLIITNDMSFNPRNNQ